MPRTVLAPRKPVVAVPPDGPAAPQPPGVRVLAQPTEAIESLLLGGSITSHSGPAQPITLQQSPGRVALAVSEPPPSEALSGLATVAPWGLSQPVQRPTAATFASPENPPPEPGKALRGHARPPLDNLPTARPVTAWSEPPRPQEGRTLVSPVGFAIGRRPARPLLAAPEVQTPAPGSVLAGKSPPPDLSPQQLAGVVRLASIEEPPPYAGQSLTRAFGRVPSNRYTLRPVLACPEEPPLFPGWCFAQVWPRVPSDRYVLRPVLAAREEVWPLAEGAILARVARIFAQLPGRVVIARAEEMPPDLVPSRSVTRVGQSASQMPGRISVARAEEMPLAAILGRVLVRTGIPFTQLSGRIVLAKAEEMPPQGAVGQWLVRVGQPASQAPGRVALAWAEEPRPDPGWLYAGKPAVAVLLSQQLPGRVLLVFSESPRPEEGRTLVQTGVDAGAIPPVIG